MPISFNQLAAEVAIRSEQHAGATPCTVCGTPIQETVEEHYSWSDDHPVCSDCYFDKLGELVESSPIGRPGSVRAT